jgi:hypothetical protein
MGIRGLGSEVGRRRSEAGVGGQSLGNQRGGLLPIWLPKARARRLPFWLFLGWTPKKSALFCRSETGYAGLQAPDASQWLRPLDATRTRSGASGKCVPKQSLGTRGRSERRDLLRNTFFGSSPKKSPFFGAPKKPKKSRPRLANVAEVHGFLAVGAEDIGVRRAGDLEKLVVENADHAFESADRALQIELGRPQRAVNVQQNR